MNILFILLLSITTADLDTDKAMFMYQQVCDKDKGSFSYGVTRNYVNINRQRTGVAVSALFWGDIERKRYEAGESCALKWTLYMFGPAAMERLNAEIQNMKWKTGEVILFHRGLFFRLKRDEKMDPSVGSWYFGTYSFGQAWRN